MDMNTFYDFKLHNPKEKLFVSIQQKDAEGLVLNAIQKGDRKKFSLKQLLINLFKYPLMTIKIITAIHFEAFLLWKKGAIYRSRNKKIKNNFSFEELMDLFKNFRKICNKQIKITKKWQLKIN